MNSSLEPGFEANIRDEAWQTLMDAGVPLGAPRARSERPAPADIASAIEAVASLPEGLSGQEADALFAFLQGWSDHWPGSFHRTFGDEGRRYLDALSCEAGDPDLFLRLRRISLEHLARLL